MIKIFTSPSCSSCRKVKKWFDEQHIPYEEKSIFSPSLNVGDIQDILKKSENGTADIISERSKIVKEQHIDFEDMKFSEVVDFLKKNGAKSLPEIAAGLGIENKDIGSAFGQLSKEGILKMNA